MTTPRAIIFDLDGTLAVSKSPLTAEMGARIAELLTRMPVGVMSGGAYAQFHTQFLSGVPTDANFNNLYLFPTCASQCYSQKGGVWELVYTNTFGKAEQAEIVAELTEAVHKTGFDNPPQLWGEQIETRDDAQISWSALGQQTPPEVKATWDPDHKKREAILSVLVPRLPSCFVKIGGMTTIDITRNGIDKAYGVEKFSAMISTPISEMLYVGDALYPNGNDEVVKKSGIATQQVDGPADTLTRIDEILSRT